MNEPLQSVTVKLPKKLVREIDSLVRQRRKHSLTTRSDIVREILGAGFKNIDTRPAGGP